MNKDKFKLILYYKVKIVIKIQYSLLEVILIKKIFYLKKFITVKMISTNNDI
jgi:hypothetical protein